MPRTTPLALNVHGTPSTGAPFLSTALMFMMWVAFFGNSSGRPGIGPGGIENTISWNSGVQTTVKSRLLALPVTVALIVDEPSGKLLELKDAIPFLSDSVL